MKYTKFIIKKYKGIQEDLEIDLSEAKTLALIGLNECGKSTILNAIFSFDFANDTRNDGKHLKDLTNYYDIAAQPELIVSAKIKLEDNEDFKKQLIKLISSNKNFADFHLPETIKNSSGIEQSYSIIDGDDFFDKEYNSFLSKEVMITRHKTPTNDKYTLIHEKFTFAEDFQNLLSKLIISFLPMCNYVYTRNEIQTEIKISPENKNDYWFKMFNNLFLISVKKSLFDISKETNINIRNSYLEQAEATLNENFMKAWNDLGIDEKFAESLQFKLTIQDNTTKQLCVTINEKIKGASSPRNFDIKIRSDGFQWYYCFIMQLLYNPDTKETSNGVLFLLDEPGMYLNPYGQTCLLKRLVEIVNSNDSMQIVFSTHSHYMLDQDYVKPYQINIVEKNNQHFIKLYNLTNYPYTKTKTTPLTPLYEAIKIPFDESVVNNKKVLLVEGIHDFYALKLFGNLSDNYYIYPCNGATTIEKHIPFFIMRNVDYLYLVDNDFEGITKAYEVIEDHYKTGRGIWLPFPGYINDDNTANTQKSKFEMDDVFKEVLKDWSKKLKLKSSKYTNVITYLYEHSEEEIPKGIISNPEEIIKQNFIKIKQQIQKDG